VQAVLAGGTDLLVNLKKAQSGPEHLLDLAGIEGLDRVEMDQGRLRLGPMLSAGFLARDSLVRKEAPALALGAAALGSPQVRNRATLGGNICNARPAGDMSVALMAMGASVLLRGAEGEREVGLDKFILGPGRTSLAPGELLTGVMVPKAPPNTGGGFQKLGLRKALEIALASVACRLTLDRDQKTILDAGLALGAVGPTPLVSPGAVKALAGQKADAKTLASAAGAAAEDARPIDDHRGSAEYRRAMVEVLAGRALEQALAWARGRREVRDHG
jgi:CO/xanthine dehydrogenase FAD-binding subunit